VVRAAARADELHQRIGVLGPEEGDGVLSLLKELAVAPEGELRIGRSEPAVLRRLKQNLCVGRGNASALNDPSCCGLGADRVSCGPGCEQDLGIAGEQVLHRRQRVLVQRRIVLPLVEVGLPLESALLSGDDECSGLAI
jgi:hypothetical protein